MRQTQGTQAPVTQAPVTQTPVTQTPWRLVGGPLGRHTTDRARSLSGWAGILVGLTAVPVLIALGLRGWCLVNGFGGQVPLWRACYSDLPAMLGSLRSGDVSGDPVVTATVLKILAGLTAGAEASDQTRFVLLWAFVALLLLAGCVVALIAHSDSGASATDRALMFLLCPVLPLGLLISGDLVGVTLMTVGVLAWHLRHDVVAGVALALAGFSRGIALIVVVAVVVVALRTVRPLSRFLIGFGATALAVVGLTLTLAPSALTEPLVRAWGAGPSYGSLWVVPTVAATTTSTSRSLQWLIDHVGSAVIAPAMMTGITILGLVLAIGLIWWLSRRSGRPSLADLALVGVGVVLLTAPAIPVQASLWLVPLVALSSLTWRDMLIWAGAEVLYFPMVWLYLAGLETPDRGLPGGWYSVFLLLRVLAIGYLVWRVAENAQFGRPDQDSSPQGPRGSGHVADGSRPMSEFAPVPPQRVP